jgi:hypothetical protein
MKQHMIEGFATPRSSRYKNSEVVNNSGLTCETAKIERTKYLFNFFLHRSEMFGSRIKVFVY